jgi:hypothetical protein
VAIDVSARNWCGERRQRHTRIKARAGISNQVGDEAEQEGRACRSA